MYGFEEDVAQAAGDQHGEEARGVAGDVLVLAQGEEERAGREPEHGDGDVEEGEDDEGALQNDAQVVLVGAGGEAGAGERVDGGGAAHADEPGGRHGEHVAEGGDGEGIGTEAADDEDGDGLEGVLEGVGEDDGGGGAEEEEEFGEFFGVVVVVVVVVVVLAIVVVGGEE